MISWWRRSKERQKQNIRDADNLVALFGDGAVRKPLGKPRHEDEVDGDPSHWLLVRREIARRIGKHFGLDTATRYVGR